MTVNEAPRFIAGTMILISLVLTQFHSPNWSLLMTILKKLGLKENTAACS